MKTGLTKRQKDTVICFNEESDIIDVRTHNTDLRNRLLFKLFLRLYHGYNIQFMSVQMQ